jgi:hypothetical protein
MIYGNAYKNWEISQRLICHLDMLSQILSLKNAMSKQTFFWFNAASWNLDVNLHNGLKTLFFNSEYFYIADCSV